MNRKLLLPSLLLFTSSFVFAQDKVINNIVKEANENSQLEKLAHELLDVVGPRLVGTPQMKQANDWVVKNTPIGVLVLKMKNGANGVVGSAA